ncbi:unnamed protein product [Closterium sp. NIES-53]
MIALCQEHKLEHRTKHIALRYFLARELQQLRLAYVAIRANTADIFTEALPRGDHLRFSTVLGLCTVCLSDFNEGELIRFLRPCGHWFHVTCIDHWLATKTTYPVCRTDLQSPDPIATTDDSEVRTDKVEGGDNAVWQIMTDFFGTL